jgi:tetratricopeptide (TPR) repeat protein
LQPVLATDPNNASALLRKAMIERAQDPKSARKTLESIAEKNKYYSPAVLKLVRLYSEEDNDQTKALNLAVKAREATPQNAAVVTMAALVGYRKGQAGWAEEIFKEAARLAGTDPAANYAVAQAYYESGDLTSAQAAAAKAMRATPPFPKSAEAAAFVELLDPKLLSGDAGNATRKATEALSRFPGFLPARMLQANATALSGDTAKAGSLFQGILADHPYFGPAMKALVLLKTSGPPSADNYDLANRAHTLLPKDSAVTRALARCVYAKKDYRTAAGLFQESARTLPDTAESLYLLGACHQKLGNKTAAKDELKRALEKDEDFPGKMEARQLLVELELESK